MIEFRASCQNDAHYLIDIDLKCFDFAWLPEDWREASKDSFACVATWNGTPIGMVIFARTMYNDIEVLKIAVKPSYRKCGIASRLLYNCILYGQEIQATRMVMVVPESRLNPDAPDDLSQWLLRRGFRAQVPLLHDYFMFYGHPEDGVLFSLHIPQVTE